MSQARAYLGSNPTGRSSLWCARFLNMVLERNGRRGTGSDMASSFASFGSRVSGPQVGAIAVMSRGKRGGHVGIVSGIDESGNPIIISGNHGGRVGGIGLSARARLFLRDAVSQSRFSICVTKTCGAAAMSRPRFSFSGESACPRRDR